MKEKRVLAVDLENFEGKIVLGKFDGEKITLSEIHRFTNEPITICNNAHWDILKIFREIKQGLIKTGSFDSLGIDTWGFDYGLIDKYGKLIGNPFYYRDSRTNGMIEKANRFITPENLYSITGTQIMHINTAFQLMAEEEKRPYILENTKTLLMMPDLIAYLLTGTRSIEYSIASTTQLLDYMEKKWSARLLSTLGIRRNIFPEIVQAGSKKGVISAEICEELGILSADVVAVCEHAAQSAVVAVPAKEKDFIFINCGTWSILGTELENPVINNISSGFNITNEGGFGGTATFLKNITGLWLIQETKRCIELTGHNISYPEMENLARNATPFQCFINPDAPEFVPAGNIPKRICEYCEKTGQYVPKHIGEVIRCIYESLAFAYRKAFDEIRKCTGKEYSYIYMLGDGTQDKFLCQLTANACGMPVKVCNSQSTVIGNIAVQLISSGEIPDIAHARKIIADSFPVEVFQPQENRDSQYKKFLNIAN